jgi:hypothetical protein
MRVSLHSAILCAAAVGLVLPVAGQSVGVTSSVFGTANRPTPSPRLPYTAEFKVSHVQTLVNGITITRESTETVALDSQGRRMTSSTTIPLSGNQPPITRVNIFDPVARTSSNWTVPGQKATVIQMSAPGAQRNCATAVTLPPRIPDIQTPPERPRPIIEDLGTQTINGVEARGHRIITTTPVGAIGNDAPLVSINEMWTATAPGLRGLVARSVMDGPQSGKSTRELTNFTQAEPDASVFQPPEGYEIVNRPAPGSVCPGEEGAESPAVVIPPPPPPQ